jgi:hypothetical protein
MNNTNREAPEKICSVPLGTNFVLDKAQGFGLYWNKGPCKAELSIGSIHKRNSPQEPKKWRELAPVVVTTFLLKLDSTLGPDPFKQVWFL